MGNLASTLARISSRAPAPQYDALTGDLLREAALFVEWSAPHIPPALLVDLAALQRELLAWRRIWPLSPARPLLALYARNTSDRVPAMAGLTPRR